MRQYKTYPFFLIKLLLLNFVILFFLQSKISAQYVHITAHPSISMASVGQNFTVNIVVDSLSDSTSLDVVEIHLTFDNTKLSVDTITKPSSDILGSEPTPLAPKDTINAKGQINYAAATSSGFPTAGFTLLSITFNVISSGSSITPLSFLSSFPNRTNAVRNGYSVLDTSISCSITLCGTPTATIAASSTCDAADVSLSLSSATGHSPYSLVVNGTTYTGVTPSSTFATISFPSYKIWPSNPTPGTSSNNDGQAVQVGVKFRSSTTGFVKGIRFYNGNNNSGTYTGKLWKYSNSTLLGSVNFSNVTTNGWQEINFSTPISIAANTTYIASYYSSAGNYANDNNFFTSSGVTNGPLTALQDGVSGANSVYKYGTGIPNNTWQSANYWVDVIFSPNTNTFNLTAVTDSFGCSNSGSLQTLNVTSTVCSSGRFMNNSDDKSDPEPEIVRRHNLKRAYSLEQNYPNPFNKQTTIQFSLPKAEIVILSLFDVSGRVVKILIHGSKEAGRHTISFNASSLTSGVYYYKMQAGDFTDVKKLTIQ